MNRVYRVRGHIRVQWVEFCTCSYCEGHNEDEKVEFDTTYLAVDADEVKHMIVREYKTTYDYDGEDLVNVEFLEDFVIYNDEEHQDRVMRVAGYATLPGID